jgi:effector-binding domain-containing protein
MMQDEPGLPGRYEVVTKPVEAMRAASVREALPSYAAVGGLFGRLRGYAERNRIPTGAWISVWHDPEFREGDIDGEATFATDAPLPKDGGIEEHTLPAVETMACTVHHGSFATIGGAYAALLRWIDANGYRVSGPNREVYLRGGESQDDPEHVTEVQFPVERPG